MNPTIPILSSAFVLGATSGLSPGPLLTLVVTESFQRGFRAGAAIAIAPLITDAPIILLMMWIARLVSSMDYIIGGLYLAGAIYLAFLAFEIIRFKGTEIKQTGVHRKLVLKGVIVNLLNPSPYIFWLTIGTPMIVQAQEISWLVVAGFVGIFYVLLVGLKLVLAVLIGRFRHLLESAYYLFIMRSMGVILFGFAIFFAINGIRKIVMG
ncbi:LysE family transporter [candidate division KSB1 bacterium]|nr:LysE family transporter [candidate division KSB1 bacterium]